MVADLLVINSRGNEFKKSRVSPHLCFQYHQAKMQFIINKY